MHCKSLWIKASAKCISVNVNIYKQWFTEQVALSLNTFTFNSFIVKMFFVDKNLPQLMLITAGSPFTIRPYNLTQT